MLGFFQNHYFLGSFVQLVLQFEFGTFKLLLGDRLSLNSQLKVFDVAAELAVLAKEQLVLLVHFFQLFLQPFDPVYRFVEIWVKAVLL